MEKRFIGKIERKKGLDYRIDREGNITEESYSWFKDKTTLVVLAILILAGFYYFQMSQSATNVKNFDSYCVLYSNLRSQFIQDNPNSPITLQNVLSYYESNKLNLDKKFNLTPNG